MICALIVIGLLSLGAVSAEDISANDSPQSIYVEDINHFVEVSYSEDLSEFSNLNLLEANDISIAGDTNLNDNITGNITLNSTDLDNNVVDNEDSKLTLNRITNKLLTNDITSFGAENIDVTGVNELYSEENDLLNATLVVPKNYSDEEYGDIITVEIQLFIDNETFALHGNDKLKLFLHNGVSYLSQFEVVNLSEGTFNTTIGAYVYSFDVDTAHYFNFDLIYTPIIAEIYSQDDLEGNPLVESNRDCGITFTKKCPVIVSDVIVGKYSDVVNLTFNVTVGKVGDTVVLYLINGSNITSKVINQSGDLKVIFNNVTLTNSIVGDELYITDIIYLGNETYRNAAYNVMWNISKLDTSITFNPEYPSGKTTEVIQVNVTIRDEKGNLVKQGIATIPNVENITLVYENGTIRANNTYEFVDGVFTFYLKSNVGSGYDIKVNFISGILTNNTDNYNPSNGTVHINVAITQTNVTVTDVTAKVDEAKTVIAHIFTATEDINEGNATLKIISSSGREFIQTVNVINGYATFTNVSMPEAGNFTTQVTYNGVDGKYQSNVGDGYFNVTENATSVTVTNITDAHVGENRTINVHVNGVNKAGSTVNITITDATGSVVKSDIVNVSATGDASISCVFPVNGTYNVSAQYLGLDKVYATSNGTGYVNVARNATVITIENVTTHVDEIKAFNITVKDTNGNLVTDGKVNVTVGDKFIGEFTLNNGVATVTNASYNESGIYGVSVKYFGSQGLYIDSESDDGQFEVLINQTSITVNPVVGQVGENLTLNITVNDMHKAGTNKINVTITDKDNNTVFTGSVDVDEFGKASISNIFNKSGIYNVSVQYLGLDKVYAPSNATTVFAVGLNETTVIVDSIYDAHVRENKTINITVNYINQAGKINVTISHMNGTVIHTEIDVDVDDTGKASINYAFDIAGNYNVTAHYSGIEGIYTPSTGSGIVIVNKNDTVITVENVTTNVSEAKSFNIYVKDVYGNNVTEGAVTVIIGTKVVFANVTNGLATIENVSFDLADNYTVSVNYYDGERFSQSTGTGWFNVIKNDTSVIVTNVTSSQVGDKVTVYVDVTGVHKEGSTVLINITCPDGSVLGPVSANVSADGKASYEFDCFDVNGTYNVFVYYEGLKDVYNPSNGTGFINVYRNDTVITVENVSETHVSEITPFNITVKDVYGNLVNDGYVNVTIGDKFIGTFEVHNGIAQITNASYPTAGNHTVYVNYFGSTGHYSDNSTTGYFNVIENATTVIVSDVTGQVGTNITVNITVDGVKIAGTDKVNITVYDSTGSVVDNELIDIDADGKAQYFHVFDVNGTYTVYAEYLGLDKVYLPSNGTGIVTVLRNDTVITVNNVSETHVEEITPFNITVEDVYGNLVNDGYVNVTIGDKFIGTFEVHNGIAQITNASYPTAGNKTVYVDYFGSLGHYSDNSTTGWFNVLINQTSVEIKDVSSQVGDEVTIDITVNGVHKQGSKLVNVTITDFTGKVIDSALVDIDANGKANYTLAINKSGIYNATVKYLGVEDVYAESTGYGLINVSMNATELTIENVTTRINETVDITISVKDIYGNDVTGGTVTITVNGTKFGPFNVTDGKAVIEDVKVGFSGNFTVTAEYSGYEGVYENSTSSDGWIDVLKYVPDISTDPEILDDVIPGSTQNITIDITTPIGDVTVDKVNVTLPNGTTLIDVPVVDGKITITLPDDIQEGQNITISVPETDTSYSGEVNVPIGTVALVPTYIVSEYLEGQDYFNGTYAQTTNLTFKIYDCYGRLVKNGTKVIVDVNGVEYESTVFEDGKVMIPVEVFTTGWNEFTVKYIGNDYYDNCSNTTKVFINNLTTVMEITGMVDDVYPNPDNTNVTIVVKTTDGDVVTKGQLIYTLPDGSEHVVDITGESTVLHIDVNRTGDYTIDVKYIDTPEDTHFAACNGTFDWHVVPGQTNTTLDVVVIDGVAYVEATVIDGKGNLVNEGNITISINGKEFTVNVTDGKAYVSDIIEHGIYTVDVSATYNANENYNESSANTTYIIKQKLIITVDDVSGKPGETVLVPVHVVTEDGVPVSNITVKVTLPNGKVIKVAIVDGVGYFNMTLPKVPGKYSLLVSFDGDDYYYPANATAKVTVKCLPVPHKGVPMQHTGIPILALLLVLLSIPLVRIKKE